MIKKKIRFYELDLLRFFAALAVVMFHFMFRGQEGNYLPVTFEPLDQYARYGYLGVNLFFMISGFVILLSAMNRTAIQFAISRMTRLYPAFWVGVSLTALVIVITGSQVFAVNVPQYFVNLTMMAEFLGVEDVDGAYWTLYVELKFYAIIFAILLFKKINKIEYILSIWLLIILLSLISPLPKLLNFIFYPEWAPYFISGSSFYLLKMHGINMQRAVNLVLAFCLSLFMAYEGFLQLNIDYGIHSDPLVAVLIVFIFHMIFILMAFNKLSWFRAGWAVKIGALTYPLYLIHQNIGYILFSVLEGITNKYILLILIMCVLLSASWLIHINIEKKLGPVFKRFLETVLRQ